MNKTIFISLLVSMVSLAFVSGCQQQQVGNEPTLDTELQKVSYSYGYFVGMNLRQQGVTDIENNEFVAGLKDALANEDGEMTSEEMQELIRSYGQKSQEKAAEIRKELAEANLEKSQQFLQENKTKEGIQVTDSGLQYKVLEEGSGASPSADDKVTVHYKGTLPDGTTFDSSYERGEPASFPVGGVIKGWTEALQMMKEGSKWMLYIPPELAYGERGAGPRSQIGPNQVLIFEVELLEVNSEG